MSARERASLLSAGLRFRSLRPRGARRKLLCLHGFLGRAESWDEIAASVSQQLHCEVVTLHLPGHDTGSPARTGESFDACVDRVLAGLAAFGPGPWSIAGYSMGARLALRILLRDPARWTGALLIGVNPGLDPARRSVRREMELGWQRRLRRDGLDPFLSEWEALPLFASQSKAAPERRLLQKRMRRKLQAEQVAACLDTLGLGVMPSSWDALETLDLPLRLLVGEDDCKFAALSGRMARRLPRATHASVPGAGHNLLLEAPHSVAGALREMLR